MSQPSDLIGQKFNRLIVIERKESDKWGNVQWLCKCDCGNYNVVTTRDLKNSHTKSCGCLHKEIITKHGHGSQEKSQIYKTWGDMKGRCNSSSHKNYKNYGGRGIKVCKKWEEFEGFFQDMGERPPNMSIDRIDNNGDYCKENCKWSTRKEQMRNTRQNKLITINGETKCLIEWCEIYQKSCKLVGRRISRDGWTPEEALELIPRKNK